MASPLKTIIQYLSFEIGYNKVGDEGMSDLMKADWKKLVEFNA